MPWHSTGGFHSSRQLSGTNYDTRQSAMEILIIAMYWIGK